MSVTAPSRRVHAFGDCRLDVAARELRRGGDVVHLQPKAFDVLVYLLDARDRVVTKDELLDKLWPGEFVGETSLSFAVKAVRRAIGDDGSAQRVIRTIHGRGFRFVAELDGAGTASGPGAATSEAVQGDSAGRDDAPAAARARERILIQGSTSPFIGRDDERVVLDGELAAARAGQTRTVFVLGEPGVGKTRLAAEFAEAAEASGVDVLVGRCDDGSPPAFWPWVQLVRSFVERRGRAAARAACGDGLADIARVVPGLLDADEESRLLRPAGELEAEHARLRLFDSLVGFVREAARLRPLLLVLDDLQWADASSLLVLRHLVRELAASPLLVLGTYRHMEVDPGSPLADLLGWLHRTRRSTRIRLVGLADEEVGELVREICGREPSEALVEALGRATDGNPFFVEEYCRDLASEGDATSGSDAGALPKDGARQRAGAAFSAGTAAGGDDALPIPEQVRELLGRRIARLDDGARQILAVAAVLGREFQAADLAAAGDDDAAVADALEAAERSGFLRIDPARPGRFVFAHALVAEVLRDSLGAMRRAQQHRRIARMLEARVGGDELLRATALAHHWSGAVAAGEAAKAFEWETRTGDLLLDRYAYEDAQLHYDRALALAREGACDDRRRYELLLTMARASFRTGEDARVREIVFEAVAIAKSLRSVTMLARAALRTTTLFPVTPDERIALLEEALAGLRAEPGAERQLLARVLSALASALYTRPGDAGRRDALIDEALEIAREGGDARALLGVLRASHVALWRPGYLARRLALAREHLDVAEASGDLVEMASARTWLVPALIENGEMAEADRQIDRIDREATESRMLVYRANALSFRAMRALTRGAFDETEFLARRSYEMSSRYNETTASMTLWSQTYYMRREQARLSEIEAGIHLFASQVTQIPWDWLILHLLVEDGRTGEAAPILARFVECEFEDALPPEAHIVSSAALFGLAEVAWRMRSAKAAAMLLPRLEAFGGNWVTVGLGGVCLGAMAYAKGLALATAGRGDEAVRSLEQAVAEHEAGDVPLPLLRSRVELGCVLLSRRDRASRTRARRLLDEARVEAERLGLAQLLGVIEAAGA